VEASRDNLNVMKTRKDAAQSRKDRDLAQAEAAAEKVAAIHLVLKGKAGGQGRLFGSITGKDIADALKSAHRLEVDKKKIVLDEPIKNLGDTVVDIKLHAGVTAKLKVTVEAG
jgi:large subunit ribosomal protein L9